MDYKNTLNLPKTEFPMKADLPKREPQILKNWTEQDIYRLISKKSVRRSKYILHDGPPYANGNIHIGHALNKTLKDIVVKFKTMQGYDSAFVPGWDCHGLPVEHQLFKELGINKYQIEKTEFRKKAYDYALNFVAIQKEEFIRLGIFGDWQNPYLTLMPDYEESIVNSFKILVEKKYIYRGLKPVNWCYKCETALAEAEVEYEDHVSPSVYVKFKLDENEKLQRNSFLVIWTTTPWTLIANVAVAVQSDFIYSYISTDIGNLFIAKELLSKVSTEIGIDKFELIKEVKGRDLDGITYNHPLNLRKGRVVLADYVSKEEGTGLVHTAPGHGNEDYLTGLKYKLEMIMPVDEKGNFDATAGEFKGLNVYDANRPIIEKLKQSGALVFDTKIQHSYPHCWRCRSPIIFRATKQWFLEIDKNNLRKKLLEAIDKDIQWIPAIGKERISAMVSLRPDWCLSRQRYWGVPIPALICNNCKEEFLVPEVIGNFGLFVAKEGTDCWFKRDLADFLPKDFHCPNCKGNIFSKGADIMDVWFDSGVSHQAVLKKRKELAFPCDLYLEGSDQHRGWFQSSLIPAMCIDAMPPYKIVLTHGHVVDGEGRKMSKSLGNVIPPQDIIKDYGADILRLWVAASDYNEDIRISPQIVLRLSEAYRKIRNTAKFMLSNLYDFNPRVDKVSYENLKAIDKWALFKLERQLDVVGYAYSNFEFYKAYKAIYDFCNEALSMYYLDMVKGRLYTCAADSMARRAAQTVIYENLNVLVRIMAPILVFTAEEIWKQIPKENESPVASVHLLEWPQKNPIFAQHNLAAEKNIGTQLGVIIGLIPGAAKLLEEKRGSGLIGSSFDAKINILTNNEIRYKYLESLKADLSEIFKVSQVSVLKIDSLDSHAPNKTAEYPDIAIEIHKADGIKCPRCWNYSLTVSVNNEICEKCLEAIGGK